MAGYWTNEKLGALIVEFREHPVLWNPKHPDFRDRLRKSEAWNDISLNLRVERYICERKMNILRTQFRREWNRKKEQVSRLGYVGIPEGAVPGVRESRWYAYESLKFLEGVEQRHIRKFSETEHDENQLAYQYAVSDDAYGKPMTCIKFAEISVEDGGPAARASEVSVKLEEVTRPEDYSSEVGLPSKAPTAEMREPHGHNYSQDRTQFNSAAIQQYHAQSILQEHLQRIARTREDATPTEVRSPTRDAREQPTVAPQEIIPEVQIEPVGVPRTEEASPIEVETEIAQNLSRHDEESDHQTRSVAAIQLKDDSQLFDVQRIPRRPANAKCSVTAKNRLLAARRDKRYVNSFNGPSARARSSNVSLEVGSSDLRNLIRDIVKEQLDIGGTKRDECISYGEHVGFRLQRLSNRARSFATHLIDSVLHDADMGAYDVTDAESAIQYGRRGGNSSPIALRRIITNDIVHEPTIGVKVEDQYDNMDAT